MKRIVLFIAFTFAIVAMHAQTDDQQQSVDELKTQKTAKQAELDKLQGEIDGLQGQIDAFPGWKFGAFGTLGANFSGYNDWYSNAAPNSSAGNIGFTLNGYANLDRESFFWKNKANVNLSWVKLDDKNNPLDSEDFDAVGDVFKLSSLFGYKLSDKWALSSMAEYNTTLINNFNDPGYLDWGAGATWTPIQNLVVVVHPINYNYVFSSGESQYESSLGAKIVADYTRKFGPVNFSTNFTTFQSYKTSDYSNWTWTNSLGYTFWKGIGLGLEVGLRDNKQEGLNNALATDVNATFDNLDNKMQSYWLFGINYNFNK